jgi:serine/threonine protein phosphatase PrpC
MKKSPLQISGLEGHLRDFRLDCAALCAPRPGRTTNEDRCVFAAPGDALAESAGAGYLFAVIDGASQGGRGGQAAQETAASLLEILEDERRLKLRPDLLRLRLLDANDRVSRFVRGRCAVTAVWVFEDPGRADLVAHWAHVGDTRLYHQDEADRDWRRVTFDHAKGPLLLRAIGDGDGLVVETGELRLARGSRLALVSDGVWKGANPREAIPRDPFPGPAEATRRLVGQARLNGTGDDTTAIVIGVRASGDPPPPEH